MTVELDVLDAPDVAARVHQDAAPQHAAINAADAMAHIAFRADANAVVTVDERDVLDRVVVALEMERPGVGVNVGGLLLGIEHGQAAHRRGMPHLEQRRRVLLVPPAGGQDDRAFQRLGPDRRLHHALQRHARWNAQAACDEVARRRQQHPAAGFRRLVERLLNRRGIIGHTIGLGAGCGHGNRPALFCGRCGRRTDVAQGAEQNCEQAG